VLDLPAARADRTRVALACAGVFTIGLAAKLGGEALPGWLGNAIGGAAYTAALALGLLWLRPALGARGAACLALLWSVGVELWQLGQLWPLGDLRRALLVRLVLGSHFDPRDLAAYALGAWLGAWVGVRSSRRVAR
jgi:hypothetical protein